ncbi:ferritin-like domain-containing protein [Mycobacterium sp.]|uniref:ferritin-like domain-containing protein n=1 Tax=Mycobacterium sp. TaxID=1785 RepID=UPI0031D4B8D4
MTSAEPSPTGGPDTPYDAALCAALASEHAVIYGYGIVSAQSQPDVNSLVSVALAQHRERRDQVAAMLAARSVTAPVAAAGYQLPMPVNDPTDADRLAARMELDDAVAWRAVVEQAPDPRDRRFAVTALTQCAVLAARWNRVVGVWPITTAFPGGGE